MGAPPSSVRRFASRRACFANMRKPKDWAQVGRVLSLVGHGALPRDDDNIGWFHMMNAPRLSR